MILILVSAVGFGCGLNYREVGPFWLPLTVWMGYRFTGGGVLLFVRRLPAIPVTVLYRRSVGGKFPAAAATKGGATIGAGSDMSPPLLQDVPRRGYNLIYVVHLRGTTAGR